MNIALCIILKPRWKPSIHLRLIVGNMFVQLIKKTILEVIYLNHLTRCIMTPYFYLKDGGSLLRDVIFIQSSECTQEGYKTVLFDADDFVDIQFRFINTIDTDDLFRYSLRLDIVEYNNDLHIYTGYLGNYSIVESVFGKYLYLSN